MRKAGTSKSFKNGVHNQRLLTKADDPFLAPIVQTHCSRQRFSSVQLLTGKSLRNELSMTTIHQEPKWPEQDDVEYPDDDVKRLCRLKKKKTWIIFPLLQPGNTVSFLCPVSKPHIAETPTAVLIHLMCYSDQTMQPEWKPQRAWTVEHCNRHYDNSDTMTLQWPRSKSSKVWVSSQTSGRNWPVISFAYAHTSGKM